jgi:transcriptional regulator with XRE-family HTH domain
VAPVPNGGVLAPVASEGELVTSMHAHGYVVGVWRRPGQPHLQLEAVMANSKPGRPLRADAGTADTCLASGHAHAFAAQLADLRGPASGQDLRRPTYNQLQAEIERRGNDVANMVTQLRAWRAVHGIAPEDEVGAELGVELGTALETFRDALLRQGKSPSTVSPYVSRIRRAAEIASALIVVGDGLTFAEALDSALTASGVSVAQAVQACSFTGYQLRKWRHGHGLPSAEARVGLGALEKLLRVPLGSLSDRLPPAIPRTNALPNALGARLTELLEAAGTTAAAVSRAVDLQQSTLSSWRYSDSAPATHHKRETILRIESHLGAAPGTLTSLLPRGGSPQNPRYTRKMSEVQLCEWNGLFRQKTSPSEPNAARRPNTYWRISSGRCATAELYREETERFYSYLALPTDEPDLRLRGRGFDPDSLSLAHLACYESVVGFMQFVAERTGYTNQTLVFVSFVASLLRPRTGYLWQAHDIRWSAAFSAVLTEKREGGTPTLGEWQEHCESVRQQLLEWIKHLDDNDLICQRRDQSHIAGILSLDRPMDVLKMLELRMRTHLAGCWKFIGPTKRARGVRNLLLISMLIRNPLRAKHWAIMTYRDDGTGHLRKRADGHYELAYAKSEFKALAGFRRQDYCR